MVECWVGSLLRPKTHALKKKKKGNAFYFLPSRDGWGFVLAFHSFLRIWPRGAWIISHIWLMYKRQYSALFCVFFFCENTRRREIHFLGVRRFSVRRYRVGQQFSFISGEDSWFILVEKYSYQCELILYGQNFIFLSLLFELFDSLGDLLWEFFCCYPPIGEDFWCTPLIWLVEIFLDLVPWFFVPHPGGFPR